MSIFGFAYFFLAPLSPNHVREILHEQNKHTILKVFVQPSTTRIFSDTEYLKAGAILQEDLSEADVILGVKKANISEQAMQNKTLLLFAHVIKGANMSFLSDILQNNIRFIDYECITHTATNSPPKRLVAFGEFAGMAGMIDILQGLGQQLLLSGNETYSTPFLSCPLSYMHPNLVSAFASVARIGRDIQRGELPRNLPPLVFAFTGKGNVIRGATQVFEKLPVQWLSNKDELKQVVLSKSSNTLGHRCVYGYMVKPEDIYVLKKERYKLISSVFNKSHYRSNPHEYTSVFGRDIAPFINVLVNGAYWDERYPRILTKEDIRMLYEQGNTSYVTYAALDFMYLFLKEMKHFFLKILHYRLDCLIAFRLIAIADISCDINGSIEFLDKATSIDHPFFHYNPLNGIVSDHFETSGRFYKNNDKTISVMGVDILPAELARESSEHFGNALLPLLTKINIGSSANNNIAPTLPPELELACIAEGGQLKPRYGYLATFLARAATTVEVAPFTRRDDPPSDSANGLLKYSSLISLEAR